MQTQAKSLTAHPGLNMGIAVHISFLCVSHARQETHVSWSQKNCQTPCILASFASLHLSQPLLQYSKVFASATFSSSHMKELSGKYSEGSREGERVKDGLCWLRCGNLAGNSEPHLHFVVFSLCQCKKERKTPSDKHYELNWN